MTSLQPALPRWFTAGVSAPAPGRYDWQDRLWASPYDVGMCSTWRANRSLKMVLLLGLHDLDSAGALYLVAGLAKRAFGLSVGPIHAASNLSLPFWVNSEPQGHARFASGVRGGAEGIFRKLTSKARTSAVGGRVAVRRGSPPCVLVAICGRLPVGKGFLDGDAGLVGAAICSACYCGAVRWPLAIILSADQVPVKSTQSQCCNG